MRVSGFTFLRNASLLGYPYIESLQSLLAVCDEVIVAVGEGDDDTLQQVLALNDVKLRVISTTWNEKMQDRGYTYAQQKMLAQFNCTGDWAFYLEGDEVLHELDYAKIRQTLELHHENPQVEAIVFDYYHFYGSPHTYAYSPRWYRRAPRIIRNSIRTWAPDGLFWLVMQENRRGRYPRAVTADCYIYHYGHLRSVAKMNEKQKRVERYWGKTPQEFLGYGSIDPQTILNFRDAHPRVMRRWLSEEAEQQFIPNPTYHLSRRDKRHRWLIKLEKLLCGMDLTKKHYKLIKR
jgi:hypothetical protein